MIQFITIALIVLFSAVQTQALEKLIFSTFPDSDTPNIVIAQAVVSGAYRRLNIDIEVKYLPGHRAVKKANNGKVDGLLFHIPGLSDSYANLIQVKVPVFYSELVAFVANKSVKIDNWDDLRTHRIGFVRGFFLVEERTKGAQVEVLDEQENMLLMLARGRIDVAVDTYLTGLFTIKKLGLKGLRVVKPPLENFSSFQYLNKKHRALIPQIESVLADMQKEGVILKIRNRILKDLMDGNS